MWAADYVSDAVGRSGSASLFLQEGAQGRALLTVQCTIRTWQSNTELQISPDKQTDSLVSADAM